jgi:threonine aldolase
VTRPSQVCLHFCCVVCPDHHCMLLMGKERANMPQAMLRAVAELTPQDIGDDIYGEDATVNELQRRAAELTGKEAVRVAVPGVLQSRCASLLL